MTTYETKSEHRDIQTHLPRQENAVTEIVINSSMKQKSMARMINKEGSLSSGEKERINGK